MAISSGISVATAVPKNFRVTVSAFSSRSQAEIVQRDPEETFFPLYLEHRHPTGTPTALDETTRPRHKKAFSFFSQCKTSAAFWQRYLGILGAAFGGIDRSSPAWPATTRLGMDGGPNYKVAHRPKAEQGDRQATDHDGHPGVYRRSMLLGVRAVYTIISLSSNGDRDLSC